MVDEDKTLEMNERNSAFVNVSRIFSRFFFKKRILKNANVASNMTGISMND